MIRKLIFFPLILLFISCTVTKRVHRPGYHIQWHKIERNEPSKKLALRTKKVEQNNLQDEIILPVSKKQELTSHQTLPTLVCDAPEIHEIKSSYRDESPAINRESEKSKNFIERRHKTQSESPSISQNVKAPIFWRTPPENLRKLGIAFMVLGGILIFGSLLVYLGAFSGNGSGAWLGFFLDLIDISGWFWLLFFILAIILVSYLSFLFVFYVLGGPLSGLLVGLSLLAIGLFFYTLGERRVPEPPN